MEVICGDGFAMPDGLLDVLTRAAEMCAEREGLDADLCEVSLSVAGEAEIRELNRVYRGKDSVTDVLSFPQFDDFGNMICLKEICLGDVVICDEAARRQAGEYGHSYEREFVYLFVHSVLHLLGYDHMEEEEKAEMRMREEEIMEAVGLQREKMLY